MLILSISGAYERRLAVESLSPPRLGRLAAMTKNKYYLPQI